MSSQVEGTVTAAAPRRSLFPKAYTNKKAQQQPKKEKHVSFSPYARCLKLEPLNLTEEEKAELWWQKDDYEDFSRIGKIISKAMLEGGSEVWLRSKCSSSLSSPSPSPSPSSSPTPIDSEVIPKSITSPTNNYYTSKDDTMIPNNSSSTTTTTTITTITNAGVRISSPLHLHNENEQENEHNEFSLLLLLTMTTTEESEQHESQQQQQELLGSSEEIQTKWWHRFGHSRRGLEHITASGAEGRQRHSTARSAIRCVLDEQKRQRLFPPKKTTTTTTTTKGYNNNNCCCLDADKFRSVYHPKTQWARLLARAAGDSDADAVRTNFDETKRKSREHYLRRHLLAGSGSGSKTSDGSSSSSDAVVVVVAPTTTAEMPGFMTAVLSPETRPKIRKKLDLDANTLSQLCFRNSRNFNSNSRSRPPPDKRRPKADEKKHKNKNKHKNKHKSSVDYPVHEKKLDDDDNNNNNDDDDNNNNNNDDEEASTSSETSSSTEDTSTSNLAKMAAGWGGEESTSKEDMSSVLIGMGIATTKPNITIG